jgi:hypothetical protein
VTGGQPHDAGHQATETARIYREQRVAQRQEAERQAELIRQARAANR